MQREDRCGPPCARAHTLQSMRHKLGERLSRGESRDGWLELDRRTFERSESTQENPQPLSRRQKESAQRFGAALAQQPTKAAARALAGCRSPATAARGCT